LAGQPAEYWSGDYDAAVEKNPFAFPILARGPWVFAALAVVWGAAVAFVVMQWRHWAADWFAALVTFGHAIGGASWLVRFGPWGWLAAVAYLAAVAEVTRRAWTRTGTNEPEA
jgi:hypothetical protein